MLFYSLNWLSRIKYILEWKGGKRQKGSEATGFRGSSLAAARSAGGRCPLTPAVLLEIIAPCQQIVEMDV